MSAAELIANGKSYLGIEFGSTRIKAVVIDETGAPLASGSHEWENRFENGVWTYTMEDVEKGLQDCYQDLCKEVKEKYGVEITSFAAMGFSAMMHGYLAFNKEGELLVPFRTWRNTITEEASTALTKEFGYNIPQRWSISHLYQAILNGEEHIKEIAFFTTLAGYVHWKLTGKKVLGVGDASGMFPIDTNTGDYDKEMVRKFDSLIKDRSLGWTLSEILPGVLNAGEDAGSLTAEGVKFLDVNGKLQAGIPVCPPEGDAGTGMVATNSVSVRTGNISAGTSVFAMVVLEKALTKVYPQIDLVTTPDGALVGMVHCNNCTSDINAWVNLFDEYGRAAGQELDRNTLFTMLYKKALEGDADCGGLLSYNYFSGEPVTGFDQGAVLFARSQEGKFTLPNVMRMNLYSALAALKYGLDIMIKEEGVKVDEMYGHGGYFKTPGVGQQIAADAINAPVSVMETAGEGGAWGIAILAAYLGSRNQGETLPDYLKRVIFAGQSGSKLEPIKENVEGFEAFMEKYRKGLAMEAEAVKLFNASEAKEGKDDSLAKLKKEVYEANMMLPEHGLVTFTWGNVSGIDREKGVFVIKPSGVPYEELTPDDMVVMDLNGNKVEGRYNPSSDTATHLELYKAFPELGGIVHTHSSYATSWAQAGRSIPCYGTTHADYFYGEIPCVRCLSKDEIESAYEENTGHLIVNEFKEMKKDPVAVPGVLCKNHGPFSWGKDAKEAVHNAVVMEEVAKMAYRAETINPDVKPAPGELQDKHYFRKHGANAYYGQGK